MWLVTVLLLWGPVGGQVVNPTKAVVTVQPPWVSIFKKESVTLRCEGPRLPGDSATQWFINRTALQISSPSHSITEAGFKDGGEYSCKTSLSVLSDPVQLEIHSDWLLLQASRRALIEGEPLALRCHRWKTVPDIHVVFWRNGKSFWFTHGSEVTIQKTNPSHSGIYHCTGKQKKSGRFWKSAGTAVTVKELFAVPELRASSPFLEGSLITLSCETKPQLQSPGLQLYFSFYVGNKTLADRNTSSEYRIPSAGREDSGFYWCEAATEDGSIRKRSSELELQVLGLQSSTPFWVHNLFICQWE